MNKKIDSKRRTIASVIVCVSLLLILLIVMLIRYQKNKPNIVGDDIPYLADIENFTEYTEDEMRDIVTHDTTSNLGCYYGNLSVSDKEVFKENFPFLTEKNGVTIYSKDADGNIITSTQSKLDCAIETYLDDLALYDEEVIEKCKSVFSEEHPDEEIPMYFPVTQLYAASGSNYRTLKSTNCDFYINFLIFGNDSKTKDKITVSEMQKAMTAPNGNQLNESYFIARTSYDDFIDWGNSTNVKKANNIASVYNEHNKGAVKITARMENDIIVGEKNTSTGPNKVKNIIVENDNTNSKVKIVIDGWRDYLTIPGNAAYTSPKTGNSALSYVDENKWHRSVLVFDFSYQVPTNAIPSKKQSVNKHKDGRILTGTYLYPDDNRVEISNTETYENSNGKAVEYFRGTSLGTVGFFNSYTQTDIFKTNGKPLTIKDDKVSDGVSQVQAANGFKWNNTNKRYSRTEYPEDRDVSTVAATSTSTWDNVNMQINLDYNTSAGQARENHWKEIYNSGVNDDSIRDVMDDYIWLAASGNNPKAYETGATLNILMIQNKETLTLEYETKREGNVSGARNTNTFYYGSSKAKRTDGKNTLDSFSITGGSGQAVSFSKLFKGKNIDLATDLRLDGHALRNSHIYHLGYDSRDSEDCTGFLGCDNIDGDTKLSFSMGWLKNGNFASWTKEKTYGEDPAYGDSTRKVLTSRRQNIYKASKYSFDSMNNFFINDIGSTKTNDYQYVFCNTKNAANEDFTLSVNDSRYALDFINENPKINVSATSSYNLNQILNSVQDGQLFSYGGKTCMRLSVTGNKLAVINGLRNCKSELSKWISVVDDEDTENATHGVGAPIKELSKYGIPFIHKPDGTKNSQGNKKYEDIAYSDKLFLWQNFAVTKEELTTKNYGKKYTTRNIVFVTHDRANYTPTSSMSKFINIDKKTAFPFYVRQDIQVFFVAEDSPGGNAIWRTSHYVTQNNLLDMIEDTTKPDWTYEEVTPHVLTTNLALNARNKVGSYTATETITFTHAHTIDHGCYYCPGHYHSSIYGGYYTYCNGCVRSCTKPTTVKKQNSISITIYNEAPSIDMDDKEKTESDIIQWSDIASMISISDKEDNSYHSSGSNSNCNSCNNATFKNYFAPSDITNINKATQSGTKYIFTFTGSHRSNTHTPTLTVDIGNLKLNQTNPGGTYPIKCIMMDGDGVKVTASADLIIDWVAPEFTLNESPESNGLVYHTDETIPQGDFFTNKVITKAADPMRQWAVEKPGAMQSVSEAETIDCYAAGHPIGVDLRNPLGYYNLPKYITIVDTKELYVQRRSAGAIRPNDARQQVTDICQITWESEGDSATNWRAANSVTTEKIVEVTLRCYNPRNRDYYTDRTLKVKIINDAPVVSGGTHLLTLYEQYTEDQFLDWWSTQAWDFEDGTITGDDNTGTYYGTKPYNDSRDTVFNHKSEIHQRYGIEKTQYSAIQNHSLRYNGDTYYHRFKIVEWNGKEIKARGTSYFDTTEEGTFTIIVGYWDEDMAYAEAPITVIVRKTEQQMKPYLRYIDKEFFSKPAYYGGLADDSIWKTNPEYNKQLEEDLNTDVTDASEENNWKGCEIVYVFEPDDIKEFKEYIKQKVYNPKPNGSWDFTEDFYNLTKRCLKKWDHKD